MTVEPGAVVGSRERRLGILVDELRADVANGLHYDPAPGDKERFIELRDRVAALMSMIDLRDADTLGRIFAADGGPRTPLLGVVLVLSDQRRGLLLRIGDDGIARAPRAFVDPAIDPEAAVKRLAASVLGGEEALPVPHGLCDSIAAGVPQAHTYYLTYVVDVTFMDTTGLPLVEVDRAEAVDPLTEYLVAGAERTVLEVPFAPTPEVRDEFGRIRAIAAAGRDATADPYNVNRFGRVVETMDQVLDSMDNDTPLRRHDFGLLDVVTPITAAETLILDERARVLLMRRADTGEWAMPGGACEVGETSAATAVRETEEELGIHVDIEGLAGVYPNRQVGVDDEWVLFLYVGRLADASQKPQRTAEAADFGWYALDQLDDLRMFPGHRVKIERAVRAATG
ncbi:NUDIX domain-containing protein [Stackebrandtia soli]|uniref:NUDIX domain-containing protein n=1 Tax=Stackebrandtia soli TaxID=1892856 RepID=UPI0039ED566C